MTQTTKPIIYYIDAILLTILIITVIYAQIMGKYVNKEVITIETCNGQPTLQAIQTLKQLNYQITPNNNTLENTQWNNNQQQQNK